MHHIIATDEAGYGPNLGPLVVGSTRWCSSDPNFDFQAALSDFVSDRKSQLVQIEKRSAAPGLMIADSKAVYTSGKIDLLERGVLASLYAVHSAIPNCVSDLMTMLSVDSSSIQDSDYFRCERMKLPLTSDTKTIAALGDRLAEALKSNGASLEQISVAAVFPGRFNLQIEKFGNKASCLTFESLELVRRMIDSSKANASDRFDIRCDKHGGRNRYASAIQEYLNQSSVTIETESRPCSRYGIQNGSGTIEFNSKGESWLPIALASMFAKYVREIYMHCWNDFWQGHLPDLKPTKGYPVDAKRFKQQIASKQNELGVSDVDIWRFR